MPLHRDIYWVGKQWAVTGYGMQAFDQKLKGAIRYRGFPDLGRGCAWTLLRDAKMVQRRGLRTRRLAVARKHYPEPPRKAPPKPGPYRKSSAGGPRPRRAAPVIRYGPHPVPANHAPAKVRVASSAPAKVLPTWRIRAIDAITSSDNGCARSTSAAELPAHFSRQGFVRDSMRCAIQAHLARSGIGHRGNGGAGKARSRLCTDRDPSNSAFRVQINRRGATITVRRKPAVCLDGDSRIRRHPPHESTKGA